MSIPSSRLPEPFFPILIPLLMPCHVTDIQSIVFFIIDKRYEPWTVRLGWHISVCLVRNSNTSGEHSIQPSALGTSLPTRPGRSAPVGRYCHQENWDISRSLAYGPTLFYHGTTTTGGYAMFFFRAPAESIP
ncbi:hypothetical protein PV04_10576 [Phialophora macrospora]|uniref:Uncharacterized protein n=1 Tax=Phialophora macrospora TaxID=1851006 RepID=A0A0D2CBM1_9EURO|nr:hypothetical protein PV04_10576 [Phialophora macrospora]